MIRSSSKYFKKIISTETPEQKPGQYEESYGEMCATYRHMRNVARKVLAGSLLENVGREEIKGLQRKIRKLSKETFLEK